MSPTLNLYGITDPVALVTSTLGRGLVHQSPISPEEFDRLEQLYLKAKYSETKRLCMRRLRAERSDRSTAQFPKRQRRRRT